MSFLVYVGKARFKNGRNSVGSDTERRARRRFQGKLTTREEISVPGECTNFILDTKRWYQRSHFVHVCGFTHRPQGRASFGEESSNGSRQERWKSWSVSVSELKKYLGAFGIVPTPLGSTVATKNGGQISSSGKDALSSQGQHFKMKFLELCAEVSEDIGAILNIKVLKANKGEASAGMKRQCKREIPEKNPPTSGIVRHDSDMRKSGSNPAENRTRLVWFSNLISTGNSNPSSRALADSIDMLTPQGVAWLRLADNGRKGLLYVYMRTTGAATSFAYRTAQDMLEDLSERNLISPASLLSITSPSLLPTGHPGQQRELGRRHRSRGWVPELRTQGRQASGDSFRTTDCVNGNKVCGTLRILETFGLAAHEVFHDVKRRGAHHHARACFVCAANPQSTFHSTSKSLNFPAASFTAWFLLPTNATRCVYSTGQGKGSCCAATKCQSCTSSANLMEAVNGGRPFVPTRSAGISSAQVLLALQVPPPPPETFSKVNGDKNTKS
ncbi:hypothetical protein PR048_031484 [Dryococelus australis]|uniref:Uncharacterized protein n=1 Tax=Dryococelus australis TaxID=614101 RepID=A0ABQ9G5E8_9NEOP|nr:hypothetical protein PR048_031484 [Dryococelus australis]